MAEQASRTAAYMAFVRALESMRTPEEQLCDDPYALLFIPPAMQAVVQLSTVPGLGRLVPRMVDRAWPGTRAAGIARTRLIDAALIEALSADARQVVLLGAGYDSRGYRIPGVDRARVFEVDRSATLAMKKRRLRMRFGALPDHVEYVESDFKLGDLDRAMTAAGFDFEARSFFVWEGVTSYLEPDAGDATLRWVAHAAPRGSRIAFTYLERAVLEDPERFGGTGLTNANLRRSGEPWTFGLDPAQLETYLSERGFALLEDMRSVEHYESLTGSRDRHAGGGYEFFHVALAEIGDAQSPRGSREAATPQPART